MLDSRKWIIGVVFAAHDVTDLATAHKELQYTVGESTERTEALAEAKQRAESADQLKSAFIATMSRELRTPLNPEQAKQLEMVRGSVRHLLSLIDDILDLSKFEADQLPIFFDAFDLPASIDKVVAMVQPMADKKQLALRVVVAPGIDSVVSDQRRVEPVLLNLLNNAIKFTERGEITLHVDRVRGFQSTLAGSPAQDAVRLRVSDTGIGIKTENLARLFLPFQQLDDALNRVYDGSGLGLAICKRLASLMHGELHAEGEWQAGSVFTFTLPLTTAVTEVVPT